MLFRSSSSWLQRGLAIIAAGFLTTIGVKLATGLTSSKGARGLTASNPPVTCTIGAEPKNQLTAENDYRTGVWTFSSPAHFPGFSGEGERPAAGVRWLPNCTSITARCVRFGGNYEFTNRIASQERRLVWRTWIRLAAGDWLPAASVGETVGMRQPLLRLPACV